MIGVGFLWRQIKFTKEVGQLQCEDSLAKEYREIGSCTPTKAVLGSGLSPRESTLAFDELFRYFDLSNEQIVLKEDFKVDPVDWCYL